MVQINFQNYPKMIDVNYILNEWSYRLKDGIVDINDPEKFKILNEILNELGMEELNPNEIRVGSIFTLNSDLGNFKRGEKIKVTDIQSNDIETTYYFTNEQGIQDEFTVDINDTFSAVSEILEEE